MWMWGLIGWLLVSVLAAALHHRFQQRQTRIDPAVGAFLLRLETLIAERHPGVRYVDLLPDQFACLLEVDGQETPVSLHDAFRHEQTFPDGFPDYVERLIGDIREVGLDRVDDLDLAGAAAQLLPQVRSRQWLEDHGRFGDSGLVHRSLNDELVVVYVVDDPHSMVFVCRGHLNAWGKTIDDVHNLALANLQRLDGDRLEELRQVAEPLRIEMGDGFDAARVLLLEEAEGLLVALPDRDLLWVGGEDQVDLETLMADTEALAERAAHPVSKRVYRVTSAGLEAVSDVPAE